VLESLHAYIASLADDDDEQTIEIVGIAWDKGDATIELRVVDYRQKVAPSRWRIACRGVVDSRIGQRSDGWIMVYDEEPHVTARARMEPGAALMFREPPRDVAGVLGRLWEAHTRLAGSWIPFERYLNPQRPPRELLETGAGVLARGPRFFVAAYLAAVADEWPGAYLVERDGPPRKEPPRLLTLRIGDSFFVAEHFETSRLD
jgi:hypothetical protein